MLGIFSSITQYCLSDSTVNIVFDWSYYQLSDPWLYLYYLTHVLIFCQSLLSLSLLVNFLTLSYYVDKTVSTNQNIHRKIRRLLMTRIVGKKISLFFPFISLSTLYPFAISNPWLDLCLCN